MTRSVHDRNERSDDAIDSSTEAVGYAAFFEVPEHGSADTVEEIVDGVNSSVDNVTGLHSCGQ